MTQFTLAQLIAAYCLGGFTVFVVMVWVSRANVRRKVGNDVSRHITNLRGRFEQ